MSPSGTNLPLLRSAVKAAKGSLLPFAAPSTKVRKGPRPTLRKASNRADDAMHRFTTPEGVETLGYILWISDSGNDRVVKYHMSW
jgi:hypothetical protein